MGVETSWAIGRFVRLNALLGPYNQCGRPAGRPIPRPNAGRPAAGEPTVGCAAWEGGGQFLAPTRQLTSSALTRTGLMP